MDWSELILSKEKWIQLAVKLATENKATGNGAAFGAVVVKDNEIVGTGVNKVAKLNDPSQHAELQAIINACKTLATTDLSGCEIYASTEPCPMCLSAVYFTNISAVYFKEESTLSQDRVYRELALKREERQVKMKKI